jgi:site-specific recombinase XerD
VSTGEVELVGGRATVGRRLPAVLGSPAVGVLLDAFEERALEVAAAAAAPNTRRAYATVYRAFAAFLRANYGEASTRTFTVAAVAAWRDHLGQSLAPATVVQRVCAVRGLAAALGCDVLVQGVRCPAAERERPRALSDLELSNLLRGPDLRTRIGVRDRAVLELLARAGLRRSEVARLDLGDVREQGRQPDPRRRFAVAPVRGDQSGLRSWCAAPSVAAPGRCRCTRRPSTRCAAGMRRGHRPTRTPCS